MFDQIFQAASKTSVIEWLAFFTSILYVVLAAVRSIWCWLFGLISSATYVFICFSNGFFIDTGLQVFYIFMSVYGWINWKKNQSNRVHVVWWGYRKHLYLLVLGIIVTHLLGYTFENFTAQNSSYLDAAITIFSLIATFMTAHRIIENWIYWIVVDFAAIFLFAYQELYLTAFLYIIYSLMAIYGLIAWTKQYHQQKKSSC